jgi:hypothetical protein
MVREGGGPRERFYIITVTPNKTRFSSIGVNPGEAQTGYSDPPTQVGSASAHPFPNWVASIASDTMYVMPLRWTF